MLDYELRTHRAILDEFLPQWRLFVPLGPAVFAQQWQTASGKARSSSFLWFQNAKRVRDAELHLAA
jgi:hypothetical protein